MMSICEKEIPAEVRLFMQNKYFSIISTFEEKTIDTAEH